MTRPVEQVLLRLDGQYGTGAVLADLAGFSSVMRGKDYTVLDRTEVQSRLHLPPDQQFSRPESDLVRALYDCPDVPVGPTGQRCRVVVATHPASKKKSRVGLSRSGLVYELFFTNLPQGAFTAADVVALYLHRGAFEPVLADEDQEQDPDRWCSHAPWGQEAWQIISQWVWNLRLELGHQLEPTPMRTTEFAPAPEAKEQQAPSSGYGPPTLAAPWKAGRLSGRDFVLQPDGTLRCPANQALSATEQRREADGSLRLVYAARLSQCRPCPRRVQCQWHGRTTTKPRRVSLLLHPLPVGSTPLLVARIGVADSIAEPAWACCATNGLRSLFRRPRLPSHTTRWESFPARSAPIIAFRGKNGWRAMPVPLPLTDPPSSSSASQQSSPLSSVCRRRKEALAASGCSLLGQAHLSEWCLMAFFPGFPSVPLICCSFRSKFRRFCQVTGAPCPALHTLPLPGHDSRFPSARCAIRGQTLVTAAQNTLQLDAEQRQRTLVRIDAGGGSVPNLNWLLEQGYEVLGKACSGQQSRVLATTVQHWMTDTQVPERQIGWVCEEPTAFVRPVRRVAVRSRKANGQWGVGVVICSLSDQAVLHLAGMPLEAPADEQTVLRAAVALYD